MPRVVYLLLPLAAYYLHRDFSLLRCHPHKGSLIPAPVAPVGDTREDLAYVVFPEDHLYFPEDKQDGSADMD